MKKTDHLLIALLMLAVLALLANTIGVRSLPPPHDNGVVFSVDFRLGLGSQTLAIKYHPASNDARLRDCTSHTDLLKLGHCFRKDDLNAALYTTNRFRTLLSFTETYPFDPARPQQLTSINYEAVTPTDADRQKFRDSILAKYGQPYREVKAQSALWCNKGVSLGSGPLACAPDVPALQLKGNELILADSGPFHRERAAWTAKTTGAPPI